MTHVSIFHDPADPLRLRLVFDEGEGEIRELHLGRFEYGENRDENGEYFDVPGDWHVVAELDDEED